AGNRIACFRKPAHWHRTGREVRHGRILPLHSFYGKLIVRVRKLEQCLYSWPFSAFSWQLMQCFAHGTASSRFCCISSSQFRQAPYSSLSIRFSAPSIKFSNARSVFVIPNKNSFVYELAALSARSTVGSSSA